MKHAAMIAGMVLWFLLPGCPPQRVEVANPGAPERTELRLANERLSREVEELRAQVAARGQRISELEQREKTLANQVVKMHFEMGKLQEMIDVLKTAPDQRDMYKAEANRYKSRVAELELEIESLQKQIRALRAAQE